MSEKFSERIWRERYAHIGEESWSETAKRTAKFIAQAETPELQETYQSKFYEILDKKDFVPGGRILANAGRPRANLLNCFVLGLEDSRESIGQMLKEYLVISGTGGGVGISFSKLRPKGQNIITNGGNSSGPISFMDCVDQVASTIKTGGCFSKNAAITTDEGYIFIDEIVEEKKEVKCWTHMGYKKITHYFDNGLADLYKVKTKYDSEVEVTKTHKMGVWDKDKNITLVPLEELKVGDKVLMVSQMDFQAKEKIYEDEIVSIDYIGKGNTYDLEVEDAHMLVGNEFYTSNSRRAATMISLSAYHPDVEDFIYHKIDLSKLTNANVSVEVDAKFIAAVRENKDWDLLWNGKVVKTISAKKMWDKIVDNANKNGEPGILNMGFARKMSNSYYFDDLITTNPCFTGDTLIAVADGRNAVSIKQLAEEGKDVPVYSIDSGGMVSIKIGRHPRITGYNKKIVRVMLDDGSHVDTTPDHKFLLLDGTKIEAKDLKKGDSLPRFTKALEPVKTGEEDYYQIHTNTRDCTKGRTFEHRLIAQHYFQDEWNSVYQKGIKNGIVHTGNIVVHHKDHNHLNNTPENLEIMTFSEHSIHHDKANMAGEGNTQYSGYTHDEIKQYGLELTKQLKRRFTTDEWIDFAKPKGLPQNFSAFRKDKLVSVPYLAKVCASELGIEYVDVDARVIRTYHEMLSQGYNAEIIDGFVYVTKQCEMCKEDFKNLHLSREIAFCSKKCGMQYIANDPAIREKTQKAHHEMLTKKMGNIKNEQAKVYSGLKFNLARDPQKKEWEQACKQNNLPCRIGKNMKYGYKNFQEVVDAGNHYNHKVVEVLELDGEQTVYNITVDDNHTVGIITSSREKRGNLCYSGIFIVNCGEIFLSSMGSCCLGSINLSNFVANKEFQWNRFKEVIDTCIRFLDNVLTVNAYPLEAIRDQSIKERRIGLGLMGLHHAILKMGLKYSSEKGIEFTEKVYELLRNRSYIASSELAKEKGSFPAFIVEKYLDSGFCKTLPTKIRKLIRQNGMRNVCCNTQAPTGTTSIVADTTSGIEPMFSPMYKRRFNTEQGLAEETLIDPLLEEFIKDGQSVKHFEGAYDIKPEQHFKIQETAQRYIDQAVSKTINLPNDHTPEKLNKIWLQHIDDVKGATLYRSGSRGNEPLTPIELDVELAKKLAKAENIESTMPCKSGVCDL